MLLLSEELRTLPDLERGICRAFYKKISPADFLQLLTAFKTYDAVRLVVYAERSMQDNRSGSEH